MHRARGATAGCRAAEPTPRSGPATRLISAAPPPPSARPRPRAPGPAPSPAQAPPPTAAGLRGPLSGAGRPRGWGRGAQRPPGEGSSRGDYPPLAPQGWREGNGRRGGWERRRSRTRSKFPPFPCFPPRTGIRVPAPRTAQARRGALPQLWFSRLDFRFAPGPGADPLSPSSLGNLSCPRPAATRHQPGFCVGRRAPRAPFSEGLARGWGAQPVPTLPPSPPHPPLSSRHCSDRSQSPSPSRPRRASI